MGTRELTGAEVAAWAEELVPGSVAKTTANACYFKAETLVAAMEALRTSAAAEAADQP